MLPPESPCSTTSAGCARPRPRPRGRGGHRHRPPGARLPRHRGQGRRDPARRARALVGGRTRLAAVPVRAGRRQPAQPRRKLRELPDWHGRPRADRRPRRRVPRRRPRERGRLGLLGPGRRPRPHRRPGDVPRHRRRTTRELRAWVDRALRAWAGRPATRAARARTAIDLLDGDADRADRASVAAPRRDRRRRARGRAADRAASTRCSTRSADVRRAAIVGGAGTGKTMLAAEKARRLASEGFETLLVCFNSPLAAMLAEETDEVAQRDRPARRRDLPPALRGPRSRGRHAADEAGPRPAGVVRRDAARRARRGGRASSGRGSTRSSSTRARTSTPAGSRRSRRCCSTPGGRPVRLPRPGPGDLPRRRRRELGLPSSRSTSNCRNPQPIHDARRAARRGRACDAMALRDGRPGARADRGRRRRRRPSRRCGRCSTDSGRRGRARPGRSRC